MAKLRLPRLGKGIINRNRLLLKMRSFKERKATFVVAPAGYGKTVYINQFVDSVEVPFVWYQLDSFDNDPVQFFQYLISGLSAAVPNFQVDLPRFNPEDIKGDKKYYNLMVSMINELENKAGKGLIIVFDDFHLINEQEILKFMEHFISYIPNTVHVIISCRYQPDLQFLKLKASGSIMEINQRDLEFNRAETAMLFRVIDENSLNKEYIKVIHSQMNGWALGLKLLKLAFEGSMSDSTDAAFLRAKNEMFNYIFDELYIGLSPEIQKFLLYTSVLENMTPEACNYMLDSQDASKKLKYIERKNLFITAMGTGDMTSYRYHHIFRESLLGVLADKKFEAFGRAGKYYLQSGAFEQAVECFRLANDNVMLIQSIEQAGQQMLQQGKLKTVEVWLSILSERGLLESPVLILLNGELLSYSGSFAEAEEWIDKAFSLFKETGDKAMLFRTAIHKARILRYRASFAESTKFIDQLLKGGGEFPARYSLELVTEKVYSQWLAGDIPAAIETAELALSQKEYGGNKKAAERLYRYMTVLYVLQGSYSAAQELYKKILDSCNGNENTLEQGSIPLYIACIYRERGDLVKALEMLKQSVDRKQRVGFTEDLHLIYFNIVVTLLGYGDQQEIDYYCRLAQDAFKQTGGQLTYYEVMLKAFHIAITAYIKGEASLKAESLMEQTVINLKGESPYLLVYISPYFVLYYLKHKQYEKANELLELTIPIGEAIGVKFQVSMLYGLKTVILNKNGDNGGMITSASQSLELAAAERYERFFLTFPELLSCLEIAVVYGIEQEFVERIISRLDSRAVPLLLKLLRHPDSQVRGKAVKLIKISHCSSIWQEIELLFFDPDELVRNMGFGLLKEIAMEGEQTRIKLFIRCLGNFEVYLHSDWSNPLVWRTLKAKELFAYFLHWKGRPVLTERILADLWPDLDTKKARNLFHTNLTNVKSLLKHCGLEENLQKHQAGYALDTRGMACDVWLWGAGGCRGVYLEDIYSDWPVDRREELEKTHSIAYIKEIYPDT